MVLGFCDGSAIKKLPAMQEPSGFDPWVGKIPWRRTRQPTPMFLPGTEAPGDLQSMGLQTPTRPREHVHNFVLLGGWASLEPEMAKGGKHIDKRPGAVVSPCGLWEI